MEKTKVKTGKSIMVRDGDGRFVKGNQEGRKFQKGYAGKPKGAKNKKHLIAREFARDVLFLNHETGKRMTYFQLCMYNKKKADTSPCILNLLLDHYLGKPEQRIQWEMPIFNIIGSNEPKDNADEAGFCLDTQSYFSYTSLIKKLVLINAININYFGPHLLYLIHTW